MGNGESKTGGGPPQGPVVTIMTEKYSPESVKHLAVWTNEFGFPTGGSFSRKEIEELKKKLTKRETDLMKGKKVRTKDLELMNSHKKCFSMWESEMERRERKQLQSQMVKLHVRSEKDGDKDNRPKNSIYPSLTGHGGPLLNTCFPAPQHLNQPPSYQASAASAPTAHSAPPGTASC